MSGPRVSVVVPTYNYGRFLGDALDSIRSQTFRDHETIVVDDGSTDAETPAVLARFAGPGLTVVRTDRVGVSRARLEGAARARGTLVAWLDADDLWRPTYLERQVALLDAEPEVGFTFTNFERSEDGRILPDTNFDLVEGFRTVPARPARTPGAFVLDGDAFALLAPLGELPGWVQATVLRRAVVEGLRPKPGGMDAEDLYMQLQVYRRARGAFVDAPLVEVRRHGTNSYGSGDRIREGVLEVVQLALRDPGLAPAHRAVLARRVGAEWRRRGYRWFWSHDAGRAARHYANALRWPGGRLNALVHLACLPLLPLLPRRDPAF
jgi:glycosyltransferase involved in cell wall biosynthesis